MGKWLAIGGVGLIVALLLMWKEINATSADPTPAPVVEKAAPAAPMIAGAAPAKPTNVLDEELPVDDKPKKLDPGGDEFFYAFTEMVPKKLSQQAAECYAGKLGTMHRNKKLTLKFDVKVRNGVVTVEGISVKNSTLDNPALESCFIQKVARGGWSDASLPDYDWPDELVIRPERGLKKYVKENVEYVGDLTHPQTAPLLPN